MHRPTVGIIALVLLAAGAALSLPQFESYNIPALHSACLRIGLVMGAIWLALPQLSRVPPWLLAMSTGLALLVALRPKWILIALPLVVALWLLRPRERRG